jgi:hypothetical protein
LLKLLVAAGSLFQPAGQAAGADVPARVYPLHEGANGRANAGLFAQTSSSAM